MEAAGRRRQRVFFCTYPGVYSDIVLDELLRAEHIELAGVIVSTRLLRKGLNPVLGSVRQIQQSGLRYAVYLFIVTKFYAVLRFVFRRPTLRQRLIKANIPLLKTEDINEVAAVEFLRQQQADVLLSAHFNQLIKSPVLDIASLNCLNIHPSLLPAYKGVDPAFYAMLRREQQTGVTVHCLDAAFDSGDILEQQSVQVRWHDSLLSLNMKLFKLGAISAVEQIKRLAAGGEIIGEAQAGAGNYDSWPNPYDAKQFRRQRKYFRWKELLRFIRRPDSVD
ncbi:MAG: formyltransferase family protein [Thiolinea sp.]